MVPMNATCPVCSVRYEEAIGSLARHAVPEAIGQFQLLAVFGEADIFRQGQWLRIMSHHGVEIPVDEIFQANAVAGALRIVVLPQRGGGRQDSGRD